MTKKTSPKILMFAPAFPPYANPEAIVNGKLALAFQKEGWHIDIISRVVETSSYDYGSTWNDLWLSLKDKTHETSYSVGGPVYRLFASVIDSLKTRHPITGCRWATHSANMAARLHSKQPYDVILSRSLPDFGHFPALLFAKTSGLPWVANWNDAYGVKNPPPAGKGPQASLGLFHERFLKDVARTARWHTFPSERMRRHICQYLGNGTEYGSSTIPHVLLEPYRPTYREKSNVFTLSYAGNLYAERNPSVFFQALANFVEKKSLDERLRINILGLEEVNLNNLIKKYHLEKYVTLIGPLSYIMTLDCCRKSDVLIVLEAPYVEGIYLPSKFVDYVQTGRPILAISPAMGTLRDILSVHGGGLAADCTSVEDIVLALEKLYAEWLHGTLDEVYGSHRLYDFFSVKTVIGLYHTLFSELGI